MALFMEILEMVVFAVKMVSIAVLLVGLLPCMFNFFVATFSRKPSVEKLITIQRIKNSLAWHVLLGLEILIIADIIESIINPSFEDIGRLAAIVAIRTLISFFLNKEIKETASMIDRVRNEAGGGVSDKDD